MAIAKRVADLLEASGLPYEIHSHPRSHHSAQAARCSQVPLERLAKPVLLTDEYGYVVAVVPAARRVDLHRLGAQLHRDLELASEAEIDSLFGDCEPGALPGLAQPWEIPTVYDDALVGLPEVYFEAGGHDDLVRMRGPDYLALLEPALHGPFSETPRRDPER
ncbi:MAG: YbaK/EbsC family protein [Deltaproteobacteria bacterium]|nr:YbaK/EbsC family protein [Deltaproteobacteria bacterium]